jgi:hypothetical protein
MLYFSKIMFIKKSKFFQELSLKPRKLRLKKQVFQQKGSFDSAFTDSHNGKESWRRPNCILKKSTKLGRWRREEGLYTKSLTEKIKIPGHLNYLLAKCNICQRMPTIYKYTLCVYTRVRAQVPILFCSTISD